MSYLKPLTCPFCGGTMDERGGQCNYNKKIMTIDLKCKQCETIIKFKLSGKIIRMKKLLKHLITVLER